MDTVHNLVEQYLPLANKIAFQRKKLLPRYIDVEELQSAAYMGLVEAANRFLPEFSVNFMTYAYPRIRGAVQDYLRDLRRRGRARSIEDPIGEDGEFCVKDTLAASDDTEAKEFFDTVSIKLGTKAESILRLYFVDNYSMKELGQRYDLTEGRISQLIKEYRTKYAELREMAA